MCGIIIGRIQKYSGYFYVQDIPSERTPVSEVAVETDEGPDLAPVHHKAYSWEKRMEVVARYMLLGNMRVVSEQTGVNYPLLCQWKNSDWWPELVQQVKRQKQNKTNDSIVKLIEQSLDVMQDRLDNGDFVFDQKTGEVVRKPVSVRDATTIATSLLQRQQVAEEMESRMASTSATVQETLSLLAAEFKKYTKTPVLQDVTEAVVVEAPPSKVTALHAGRDKWIANKNALHDQRKEGLQEGSSTLHEQAGSSQETSGTEQSPQNDAKGWACP